MFAVEHLSKSYGSNHIFEDVSLVFPEGQRIALVGANGAGKTTLLRMFMGEEIPDGGKIVFSKHKVVAALPQEVNANPEPTILQEVKRGSYDLDRIERKMAELEELLATRSDEPLLQEYSDLTEEFRVKGGYVLEANAKMILVGLGFSPAQFDISPLELSGGWRMRVELAKLFLLSPDILILDEPTNHLDLPAINWFRKYMLNYSGTMVFVSHDRSLMNDLAQICVQVQNGRLTLYRGNFDAFIEQQSLAEDQKRDQLARIDRKKKEMQSFVDRFGAKATKARQAQSRVKMIERLDKLSERYELSAEQKEMSIKLPPPPNSGKLMAELKDLKIGYDAPLGDGHNLYIERGMRIAIVGANGLGKTTLLKTISGLIPSLGGHQKLGELTKIAYYAQEQLEVMNPEASIFNNLYERSDLGDLELRSLLGAFLFSNEDINKKFKVLSGGEKSRVGLAAILATKGNLLLLDEPTNHLDLISVERLAGALIGFAGTIVFVSHHRDFVNQIATHIYGVFGNGEHLLVEGDLQDFEATAESHGLDEFSGGSTESKKTSKAGSANTKANKPQQKGRDERKRLKSDKQKADREKTKVEKLLSVSSEKINELGVEQAECRSDNYSRLGEIANEIAEAEKQHADLEIRWLELDEKVSELEKALSEL